MFFSLQNGPTWRADWRVIGFRMGAAASAANADGSQTTVEGGFMARMQAVTSKLTASSKKYEEKSSVADDDEEEEDMDVNDIEKVQKAYKKQGFELQRTKDRLQEMEDQNKQLRGTLSDMMTAIKQLKSELSTTVSDKEAAEAHLAQMANPEREAYMHKYALEKLKEEFEGYKKEAAEKEGNLNRDLRRLQENLANRSSADDSAKASMQAEIRELKSQRGLMQFYDGQMHAPPDPSSAALAGRSPRSPKGSKGGKSGSPSKTSSPKGSKYPVADFDPSSGLKPKSDTVARAAGVVVETEDGSEMETKTEAMAKRKEAAARTGREFLIDQGVLPAEDDNALDEEDEQQIELPRIVDFVMDKDAANDMFGPDSYLQRRAQEEWDEDDMVPGEGLVDVTARDTDCHRQYMHSFGTHIADAYDTQPFIVRQDIVDMLVDFASSSDRGLAVVLGTHGMGKSHVMAAVGVTLEVEAAGAIVCPLFVGSSAGSRDTRLLLVAMVRMLLQAIDPQAARDKDAVPDAVDLLKERVVQLIDKLVKAGTPPIILIDAISEVHDLYTPPVLDWLPALLENAVVVMTLIHRTEVEQIARYARIEVFQELSPLSGEQRRDLLTHLVTKHNTAVSVELQRQKDSMREKAMAELQRLQDERMQRRLQREKLRGPSKKKRGNKNKDEKGKKKKKSGDGPDDEPEGGGLDVDEAGPTEDEGLLGTYELITMLEKPDSGHTVYIVMASEFLLSIERQLPALEEVTALPGTFDLLIDHMLDLIEDKHGKELVRSTLMSRCPPLLSLPP
jgi:hypothetical protein